MNSIFGNNTFGKVDSKVMLRIDITNTITKLRNKKNKTFHDENEIKKLERDLRILDKYSQ